MKKTIIKIFAFIVVFLAALFIIGKIMNKEHNNMTMEMEAASLPVVYMEKNGIEYNRLYGYTNTMDEAFQRDALTVLGSSRDTDFVIDTYGREVTKISMSVRSSDGKRLVENTEIVDYERQGDEIIAYIALKDLIEQDTEYVITIILELEGEQEVYYYTRVIWSENHFFEEKIAFVKDFHEKLYDKEAAKELTKYLETNSQLEDNTSFHKVNIHSSFKQITWGDLPIREIGTPSIKLTEISNQTGAFLVDYFVATSENKTTVYYSVQEYFRIRYTSERVYLLDYERTMTQIPDIEHMCANDKLLLGITDADVPMMESEDGNIVVFEAAGRLFSYNVTSNKLTLVFGFYDKQNADIRTLNNQHSIKILDVDEGGNINFAVYGYMNRGRHEGEVGIQIYTYYSTLNTIEEAIYIPYQKSYSVLKEEMEQLLYLNRTQKLYLALDNIVYGIDLMSQSSKKMVTITQDDSVYVSDNHKIMVWQEGQDIYNCRQLNVNNLHTETQFMIKAKTGEVIKALGFMGEDVIYGVAKEEDIIQESSGRIFFPMYKVCISNSQGVLLKEYQQDNIYITGCTVVDNQITLTCLEKQEDGMYQPVKDDQIVNNTQLATGKNKVAAADIDVYKRYVQIQTKTTIDTKSLKILTPKEVVLENGKEMTLAEEESGVKRYYVYGPYGVEDIYYSPSNAVNLAYQVSGVVMGSDGNCIWRKASRATRNQIMAIKEENITSESSSLAVCLDTILKFKGIIRDSQSLLNNEKTVIEILSENLAGATILDLTGCNLDSILYYVNQDIPVLAMLNNGEAVLITGFNEFNVVVMEFSESMTKLSKKGMNDTAQWLEENGNRFVTYVGME